MYGNDNFSESKVKFRQASNCCKRVLEAAKLAYANKTKEYNFPETCFLDFLRIANSVLNKGKSAIPPLCNVAKLLSSASDQEKSCAENLFKNSDLDDSGISLPVFPSRTNLKLYNISVTPRWLKRSK